MTLRVVVSIGSLEQAAYFTLDDGVKVDKSGALLLVADRTDESDPASTATTFRIYARGTWTEVSAMQV